MPSERLLIDTCTCTVLADSPLNATCELGSTLGNRRRPRVTSSSSRQQLFTLQIQSADMKLLSPYLHKASMARALLYSTSGRKYPCIQLLGVSHLLLQHYYLATAQCTSSLITTLQNYAEIA